MTAEAERVTEAARRLLGIEDESRLSEMAQLAGLMEWIWNGVPHLQATYPREPPPSVVFHPGEFARDFWRGVPNGGR